MGQRIEGMYEALDTAMTWHATREGSSFWSSAQDYFYGNGDGCKPEVREGRKDTDGVRDKNSIRRALEFITKANQTPYVKLVTRHLQAKLGETMKCGTSDKRLLCL